MPDVMVATRTLDVGLDIDNVLYPFSEVMTTWSSRCLGRQLDPDARSWSWYKTQWGISTDEFLDLYARGVQAGFVFTQGHPLPGAQSAALKLASMGHRLHYISAREIPGRVSPHLAWERTARWLLHWGFPVHSLTISDDKAARRTDVFLDDGAHNYDALVDAGHPCPVIWQRLHNLGHPGRRVSTWSEFLHVVKELGKQSSPDA